MPLIVLLILLLLPANTLAADFGLFGAPLPTPTVTATTEPVYGSPAGGGGGGGGAPAGGAAPGGGSADVNRSGRVDIFDLSILLRNWGRSGQGDINSSGRVDIFDLSILLRSWSR